jgi:hypothetical protein
MKFPMLAALTLVVVLAVLHMSGALYAKNPVLAQRDADVLSAEGAWHTIDMEQASGGARFEAPRMLNPPDVIPPLLKYPPTEATLRSLSG